MPTYLTPGIYVEEVSSGIKPIAGASTSVAAFIGLAAKGRVGHATLVTSFGDFVRRFGGPIRIIEGVQEIYLYYSVRHFFEHGGTSCYVVRAADAAAATATATIGALTVSAISPGGWGDALSAEVIPTSQYSHLLAEDAPSGTTTVRMTENTDVRVGSLLWIVDEVTGSVLSMVGNAVTLELDIASRNDGIVGTNFTILDGTKAYTPDLLLDTTVNQPLDVAVVAPVTDNVATVVVPLTSLTKSDTSTLQVDDFVNFALAEAVAVITKVGEAQVAGATVTEVEITPLTGVALPMATSRVYERGFTLEISETVDGNTEVVDTYESLSLVAADRVNHVSVRLPPEVHPIEIGRSLWISASGTSSALVPHGATTVLTGGSDALPSPAAGTNLDLIVIGDPVAGTGLNALDRIKDASILCVTHAGAAVATAAIGYCDGRKDMVYVADAPRTDNSVAKIRAYASSLSTTHAGIYFPWIRVEDPLADRRISVPPSGAIAGIYARSDAKRGVHKAPAGIDVGRVDGALGTALTLTKADNDFLHGDRINAIRAIPNEGILVWGARTLSADPEWVYMNVRRLFIFLEQSIERGTQWVAFEPNDSKLWAQLRRNISAFLRIQWLEGALVGETEEQAFYVKCDAETNPPEVVSAGMVITEIGVAPSKPAEFVVFRIKQLAGGESSS